MALVIGPEVTEQTPTTRRILIVAKEPLDNDKVKNHNLTIEFDIIDRDDWEAMSERWADLNQKAIKMGRDADFTMSDDELSELREPIHKIAAPYIRDIGPLVDAQGAPVEFTDAIKDALLKTPWLQKPIADAFMAAQKGLTLADYKKLLTKN